jgi:hypothetical protein
MITSMPHLTCNQAMVLLDIYRGDLILSRHFGDVQNDIAMLIEKDYVERTKNGYGYACSLRGENRVRDMLN